MSTPLKLADAPAAIVKPKAKPKAKVLPKLTAADQRTFGQVIAAVAAGFLPVASYAIAHLEAPDRPWMWPLVVAALVYSAPTLAEWAERWCKSRWKSWGFTCLLEGVMVFSTIDYLAVTGLAILVSINAHAAFKAAKGKA